MSAPSTPARLTGILAKIERAKHHVRDLESRISAFRETGPYRVLCHYDPQSDERVFRAQVRAQPPIDLPLIAGDAVHNLRSSLDHLAWQLVEANGASPGKQTSFPLYDAPTKYMTHSAGKVQGISPGAERLIEAVQPYQSGYASLGALGELDNIDKHRLLLVIGHGGLRQFGDSSYAHPWLRTEEGRALLDSIRQGLPTLLDPAPPARMFPMFEDGAEIMRLKWEGGLPPQEDEQLDCSVEIAFAQPQIVERQAVVPFLTQCSQLVEGVVNQFVPLL